MRAIKRSVRLAALGAAFLAGAAGLTPGDIDWPVSQSAPVVAAGVTESGDIDWPAPQPAVATAGDAGLPGDIDWP
ncbi:hypothetical protein [Streptomyces chilikensis]|uniref:hypothetical protein n=1 Tax=Streptomyces chilikensis TaxID=1194079 RepID=UPI000AEA0C4E|nr:hypothetical protein [Streptomyces chilikensis]